MTLFDELFSFAELEKVFSDEVRIKRMLEFEAALVKAEARAGAIPEGASRKIAEHCRVEFFELPLIATQAGQSGNVAVPLVRMLTESVAKQDKDAARFVHWGATSQDAIDTGMVLQLRDALGLLERDLAHLTGTLAALAEEHRATPIVARTWMQQALPTTLGFIVAGWLDAVLRHRQRLSECRARVLSLQFGGAVGTLAALSGRGPEVAKALAEELRLTLPVAAWHSHRDRMAEAATFLGLVAGTLGKIARDISLHSQTEVAELFEPAGEGRGGSSSMPHKRNPVTCAVVLEAAVRVPGLVSTMLSAVPQEYERGLGGWQAEWETLAAVVEATGSALAAMTGVIGGLTVFPDRMRANLAATEGTIFAEQKEKIGRPEDHLGAAEQFRRRLLDDN